MLLWFSFFFVVVVFSFFSYCFCFCSSSSWSCSCSSCGHCCRPGVIEDFLCFPPKWQRRGSDSLPTRQDVWHGTAPRRVWTLALSLRFFDGLRPEWLWHITNDLVMFKIVKRNSSSGSTYLLQHHQADPTLQALWLFHLRLSKERLILSFAPKTWCDRSSHFHCFAMVFCCWCL